MSEKNTPEPPGEVIDSEFMLKGAVPIGDRWISFEVQKAPKPTFLAAWYRRVKPWFDHYMAGIALRIGRQARGEAGGRTRLGRMSGTERVIMSGLSEETVKGLSKDELSALHGRCHELAERAK